MDDLDHPPVVDLEFPAHRARGGHKGRLRLWLRLLSTTKLVSQEIRRRLRAEFDATLPQFDLLAQLYREPEGLRLGELSRRTMVTNGNVTGLADRLEADGLIRRETLEADRRVVVARLTRKGRDLFTTMAKAHEGWIRELTAELDDEEIDASLARLALIKRSVRRALGD